MNKIASKRNLVLLGSVAVVGVPLAWYGYELYRGKSPRQIHEERLHDAKQAKNVVKDNVKDMSGNKDDSSWRSWLDWDSDKIDESVLELKDKTTTEIKQKLDAANKKIDREVSNSKLGREAEEKAKEVKAAAQDSSWFGWLWGEDVKPKNDEEAVHKSIQEIAHNVPKKAEKEVDWIKKTTHEAADGGRETTKATVKDSTRAAQDIGQEIADKTGQKVEEGKNVVHNAAQDAKHTVHHYGQDLADTAGRKVDQGKESARHAWWNLKQQVAHEGHHAADKAGQKVEEGKNAVHDTKHAAQQRGQELADKAGQKVEHGKATAKDALYDAKDSAQEQGKEMVDKAKEVKNESGWFGSDKKDER